ncbi:ABC transporter permease [Fulvivirga sediminis]|uniref:ABC transporter permease n=1 Tax=Fulvivirga sediminis TaxID=2803949 RepID=A0A937F498_9BACT|nr:ABC transporter permease [Fulvivirga sediminis]MBL3654736.1 ABC transporter permease [Fulvivirga sediminis]
MVKKNNTPPKLAERLLLWFLKEQLAEEVLGDLNEKFYSEAANGSLRRAKLNYWHQVIHYLRPFAIKSISSKTQNTMLIHHLKIGLRSIRSSKSYSIINISGLALGLASFLFIMLWVNDELQMDNFHSKSQQLYNVYQTIEEQSGNLNGSPNTPLSNAGALLLDSAESEIPEVKMVNHYATGYEFPWGFPKTFRRGKKLFKLSGSRASPNFFKMFDYTVIAGSKQAAIKDISSIAISRKMALLFFDSPEEAIGKSLNYENNLDFQVQAVFEDAPQHSSLEFDYLINIENQILHKVEWASHKIITTYLLEEGAKPNQVSQKLNAYLANRQDESSGKNIRIGLQPFKDQYLVSGFDNGKPANGKMAYVKLFIAVAIFILIVACINFMNLSTARSVKKGKEVAVRKVVGSSKGLLVQQFLSEFLLMTLMAFFLAILIVFSLLPAFNQFTGKQIELPITELWFWGSLLILAFITSFAAGAYPSLFLSALIPAKTLKGAVRFSNRSRFFQKGLVVFQFCLSILLLIATVVFTWQTNYISNSHLGYNKENLIYLRIEGNLNSKYNLLRKRLTNMPGIAMVDRSSEAPHAMNFEVSDPINWEGKEDGQIVNFKPVSVGFDFTKIMGLQVVEGRTFNRNIASDSNAFMVNEMALNEMGIKDPIGKWISAWEKKGRIIGVIKDFHTHSFRQKIKPLVIDVKEDLYFGEIIVRTEVGKTKEALASMEQIFEEINPDYPFNYQFLDTEYMKLYKSEETVSKLCNLFAGLAIIISCLGLLGLSMFSAQQRTKEMGIRKVLGANMTHIITKFSQEFIVLVALAFLITTPLAWLLMNHWLQGFAYRIDLSWWIFALAGLVIVSITLLTVSFQSYKVAMVNPARTLRSE